MTAALRSSRHSDRYPSEDWNGPCETTLPPARLDVGVVGAGRVGAVLGAALRRAGHRVTAVSAVSDASLARAAALLPGVPVLPADEVAAGADLLLLAVPDDALPGLVEGLAETGALRAGQLVAHTSGRHGLGVLDPAVRARALPLALHPVLPFAGTAVDLDRLTGASFGVTTPPALRPVGEALVLEMGGEPVWVRGRARPLWHAALAHGAQPPGHPGRERRRPAARGRGRGPGRRARPAAARRARRRAAPPATPR